MTTFYTARDYTDQFANLNFIINMKSLKTRERTASGGVVQQQPERAQGEQQQPQETTTAQPQQQPAENNNTNTDQRTLSPQPGPSSAAD